MGERFTAEHMRRMAKTGMYMNREAWSNEAAASSDDMLEQAAATEEGLTKLSHVYAANDADAKIVRVVLEHLGLWRDPEDCPHCRAERQVGCQRGCK